MIRVHQVSMMNYLISKYFVNIFV